MIYLKSITIENFKGIKRLDCEFDDLTVLAGLNNAGKSSILQAVHLIVGAVHGAKSKSLTERWHPSVEVRRIDLIELLSHFGIDDWQSLIPPSPQKVSVIRANFVNGLSIDLRPSLSDRTYFSFPMDDMELNREQIDALLSSSELPRSEPLTPPGDLPTRESMYEYRQYQNEVRSGQGPRLWRNGLWWALQQNGPESYQPLVTLVRKYFPEVELKLPRLASQNNHILVDYKEDNWGPFDVSQSGAGLRTFISLARMLQVSKAEIVLLDEPDSHLHASQQAIVLDLLEEAAQGNRQVILATHSPEVICRAPVESLRWVERGTEAVMGGDDTATMLERLGATPDLYLPLARHPEIIVYVEGKTDKPILESLIRWCRARHEGDLPSTLVIPHKDGRYEAVALQSIVRYRRET
ncbi:MAG TPA: AAA family ATPase, partial [Isosphaeraceae bacterium]